MFRIRRRLSLAAVASVMVLALAATADAAVVGSHPVPSYQTNGRVLSILYFDGNVYIGGKFTSVRPGGRPVGHG